MVDVADDQAHCQRGDEHGVGNDEQDHEPGLAADVGHRHDGEDDEEHVLGRRVGHERVLAVAGEAARDVVDREGQGEQRDHDQSDTEPPLLRRQIAAGRHTPTL